MSELRVNCLHTSISNWGTPQAVCDACGTTFDWSGHDLQELARNMRTTATSHRKDGEVRTAVLLERGAIEIQRLLRR